MNIIIDKQLTGNLNTDLYNLLNYLPEEILYNNEHNLRKPLGIYSVSTLRVFNAFEKLVTVFNNPKSTFEEISKEHLELLESLMAFIDDGYLMMKALFPKDKVKRDVIFADKWVQSIDADLIKKHKNDIEPFREKLALIVNKVKHNHARYCHVEAKTIIGIIKGYYIEGVNNEEVIIPDLEIHKTFMGQYTCKR